MTRSRPQRAVIIFAMILLISLGLCGANLAVNAYFGNGSVPNVDAALAWTGTIEALGILVGAGGLLIALLVWLSDVLVKKYSNGGTNR